MGFVSSLPNNVNMELLNNMSNYMAGDMQSYIPGKSYVPMQVLGGIPENQTMGIDDMVYQSTKMDCFRDPKSINYPNDIPTGIKEFPELNTNKKMEDFENV